MAQIKILIRGPACCPRTVWCQNRFGIKMVYCWDAVSGFDSPFLLQIRLRWLDPVVLVPTFRCFVSPNRKQIGGPTSQAAEFPGTEYQIPWNMWINSSHNSVCLSRVISAVINWRPGCSEGRHEKWEVSDELENSSSRNICDVFMLLCLENKCYFPFRGTTQCLIRKRIFLDR